MGEFVNLLETEVEGVGLVRLDRPKVNALNTQVGLEFVEVAKELEQRADIRAVVIWGGPRVFAAGADITEFPVDGPDRDPTGMVDPLIEANDRIESLPQITVCAVNGYALGGGCELSMSTDFRVAGEGAVFGQPEILLGIIPGAGGTQRLPRLVGVTKAKEIIYSGRMVKSAEALEIGLVSKVVPDDDVFAEALAMVAPYARGAAALRNAKKAIMDGMHLPVQEAVQVERREFVDCFTTDDQVIGVQSFLENGPGKAEFTGR